MSSRTAPSSNRSGRGSGSRSSLGARAGIAAGVLMVALTLGGVVMAATGGSPDSVAGEAAPASASGDDTPAEVVVDGDSLPAAGDSGADPALGATAPALQGSAIDGAPLTLDPAGEPTMTVFLAHWCPHCQSEVTMLQELVDAGELPGGVRLQAVATANDPSRDNYPAAAWLEREGWTTPTLLDDASSGAAQAAGVDAFPYWVVTDGDGRVVHRASGAQTPEQVAAMAAAAS